MYELPNYVTDEVLKIAILADIHVLGERKRSALDVWWTDIQVSQNTIAAHATHCQLSLISLSAHLSASYDKHLWL